MNDKQEMGSWLRAERQSRQWDVPEMARQVRKAARGDPHLPGLRDLRRMIRGWEAGEHGLSERYRLLYAAAFGIAVDQLFTGMADSGPVPLSGAPIRAQGECRASDMAGGHDLSEVESLRRDLNEVLCERSLTPASLDDWEATVMRHGQATRERPAILMLADLSADLAELRRALSGCRSSSAARRLTRVGRPYGWLDVPDAHQAR